MKFDINFIGSVCSILSLLIAIFIANKVYKIDNKVKNYTEVGSQKQKGKGNIQSGRDSNIK